MYMFAISKCLHLEFNYTWEHYVELCAPYSKPSIKYFGPNIGWLRRTSRVLITLTTHVKGRLIDSLPSNFAHGKGTACSGRLRHHQPFGGAALQGTQK